MRMDRKELIKVRYGEKKLFFPSGRISFFFVP